MKARPLNCVTLVGIEWYYDGCGSFFSSARLRFLGAPLGSAAWLGLAHCTSPWGPYQKCSASGGSWASFAFSASSGTTADVRLSSAVQKATGHLVRGRVRLGRGRRSGFRRGAVARIRTGVSAEGN